MSQNDDKTGDVIAMSRCQTYRSFTRAEVDLELPHGSDNGDHALYRVTVDDRLIL